MRAIILLLAGACLLRPSTSCAWGREGHQLVARIAMQYVTPQVRQHVLYYLQGETPEAAATWMDDVRSQHQYDYQKPWHYLNFENGQTYADADTPNVVSRLNIAYRELKRPLNQLSGEAILMDLHVLFHLTGDLHQPLHVGYGSDKGGNTVQVRFGNRGTNLHHVWDTDIIESQDITLQDCLALGKTLSPADIRRIGTINIMQWMTDSRALLRDAYAFTSNKLDDRYAAKNKLPVERQLLYAGIRLAALLNATFQQQYPLPEGSVANQAPAKQAPQDRQHPQDYTPLEAPAHIGEYARICGHITGTKPLDDGAGLLCFLTGGKEDSAFSIVIFSKSYDRFPYDPERYLQGKSVCVTGKLKDYHGQTEIIVRSAKQLTLQ